MKRIIDANISGMDLNLLLVFEAISKEQNITRAANRLGLSQPAVSGALSRLRDAVGDPLFVRGGQGVQPTPRARMLLEPIETALQLIRTGLVLGSEFDPKTSEATFTLMLTDFGEILYLPRLLAHLSQVAPGVSIHVRRLSQRTYVKMFEEGAADLALGSLSQPSETLHFRKLYHNNFVCVVRADHPTIGASISKKDYLSARHVAESHSDLVQGLLTKILPEGAELKIAARVPHALALPMIIARTDLIATVPGRLAEVFRDEGTVKIVPLPFDLPSRDIGMYWHPRCHSDPGNKWLRRELVELFAARSSRRRK